MDAISLDNGPIFDNTPTMPRYWTRRLGLLDSGDAAGKVIDWICCTE